MDKRFFNLFNLTEAEAIALLDTHRSATSMMPSDKYIAASHLINYPTEASDRGLDCGLHSEPVDRRDPRRSDCAPQSSWKASAASRSKRSPCL